MLALAVALLLAGCSRPSGPASPSPSPAALATPAPSPVPPPRGSTCPSLRPGVERSMCFVQAASALANLGGTWAASLCAPLPPGPFRAECVDASIDATPPWSTASFELLCSLGSARHPCGRFLAAVAARDASLCPPTDGPLGSGCLLAVAAARASGGDEDPSLPCSLVQEPFAASMCATAVARLAAPRDAALARRACDRLVDATRRGICLQAAARASGSVASVRALCESIDDNVTLGRCLIDSLARTRLAVDVDSSLPACLSSPEGRDRCIADIAVRLAPLDPSGAIELCDLGSGGGMEGEDCAVAVARTVGANDLAAARDLCGRLGAETYVHDSCILAAVSASPCTDIGPCLAGCLEASSIVERDACLLGLLPRAPEGSRDGVCAAVSGDGARAVCISASRSAREGDAAPCAALPDPRDWGACFEAAFAASDDAAFVPLAASCGRAGGAAGACTSALALEETVRDPPPATTSCAALPPGSTRDACLLEVFARTLARNVTRGRELCDLAGEGPERELCRPAAVAADLAPARLDLALDICDGLGLSEWQDSCRFGVAQALSLREPALSAELCEHVLGVFWRDRCGPRAARRR